MNNQPSTGDPNAREANGEIATESNPSTGPKLTEINLWQLRQESRREEAKKRGLSTPSTGSDEKPEDLLAWVKAPIKKSAEMERIEQENLKRYNERLAEMERTGNMEGAFRFNDRWVFMDVNPTKRDEEKEAEGKASVTDQEDGQKGSDEIVEVTEGAKDIQVNGADGPASERPQHLSPNKKRTLDLSGEDDREPKRQRADPESLFRSSPAIGSIFSPKPPSTSGSNIGNTSKPRNPGEMSGGLFGSSSIFSLGGNKPYNALNQQHQSYSLFGSPPAAFNPPSSLLENHPALKQSTSIAAGGLFGLSNTKVMDSLFKQAHTPATTQQQQPSSINLNPFSQPSAAAPALFTTPITNAPTNPPQPQPQPPTKTQTKGETQNKNGNRKPWALSLDTHLERMFEPPTANEITHPLASQPPLNLETHLPPNFPRYYTPNPTSAGHLNETGIYLSRARYLISLAGPPLSDMTYGIIIVPFGEEGLVLCGHSRGCSECGGAGAEKNLETDIELELEDSRRLRELVEEDRLTRPKGQGNLSWEGQPTEEEEKGEVLVTSKEEGKEKEVEENDAGVDGKTGMGVMQMKYKNLEEISSLVIEQEK